MPEAAGHEEIATVAEAAADAAGHGAIPRSAPPEAAGQGAATATISRGEAAEQIRHAQTIREIAGILRRVRRDRALHQSLQSILDLGPEPGLAWIKRELRTILLLQFVDEGGRRKTRKTKRKHFRKRTSRRH